MKTPWCHAAVAVIASLVLLAGAQGQEKIVVIENADSLVGKTVNGVPARELVGNVRIRQESVRVSCDRALQYLESGDVVLTGNVVVVDDSVTMRAPRGIFHRKDRRAEAFDDVRLDDGKITLWARYGEYFVSERRAFFTSEVTARDTGSTLHADSLEYFRDARRSVATGAVTIRLKEDNVTITGRRVVHDANIQYTRVSLQPVLLQVDSLGSGRVDTLVVRSVVMEAYRDSVRRLIAIDSVEIVRSDLAALAGRAVYFTEADSMTLRESPVVWHGVSQVNGDSINVYLRNRSLHLVQVTGHALAISRSDSLHADRFDQLTGEHMQMHFEDRILDRIDVETHAISVYHLYEEGRPNGLNKTSGDRIAMKFSRGRILAITVMGGVEGQYHPENLAEGHEADLAIPGVRWRTDRPVLYPSRKQLTHPPSR